MEKTHIKFVEFVFLKTVPGNKITMELEMSKKQIFWKVLAQFVVTICGSFLGIDWLYNKSLNRSQLLYNEINYQIINIQKYVKGSNIRKKFEENI